MDKPPMRMQRSFSDYRLLFIQLLSSTQNIYHTFAFNTSFFQKLTRGLLVKTVIHIEEHAVKAYIVRGHSPDTQIIISLVVFHLDQVGSAMI